MGNIYNFGDILWCDRTFLPCDLNLRHQEGPFLVIKQGDGFIYTVKGTGAQNNTVRHILNLYINQEDTINESRQSVRKETKFQVNELFKVPNSYVIKKLGSINENKQALLKRLLVINENLGNICLDELNMTFSLNFLVGDIIENKDERYLIIDNKDNDYYVIPYFADYITDSHFEYDFSTIKIFNKGNQNLKLIGTLNATRKSSIKNHYFHYVNKDKFEVDNENKMEAGSFIISSGKLYYVSTIEGDYLLCYPANLTKKNSGNFTYKGFQFDISFDQEKISKDFEYNKKVAVLPEEKKNKIRELKKKNKIYKKYNKNSNNNHDTRRYMGSPDFNYFGKIYYKKGVDSLGYAPYELVDKITIDCVNLEKLFNGIFEIERFHINQLEYATNKRDNLINLLTSINQEINDPRYEEFLSANGIFNIEKTKEIQNFVRKRTNN